MYTVVATCRGSRPKIVAVCFAQESADNFLVNNSGKLLMRLFLSIVLLFILQGSLVSKQINTVIITSYSNKVGQTDSRPNEAAWRNEVHPLMIAVSRDLLRKGLVVNRSVVRITYISCNGYPINKTVIRKVGDKLAADKTNQVDQFTFFNKKAIQHGVCYGYIDVIKYRGTKWEKYNG